MEYYKIRIDTTDKKLVLSLMSKWSSTYLCSFENQDMENAHCHIYIETLVKNATIRNRIRKDFGTGNGAYSMKSLDEVKPIEYLAYCIKDKDFHFEGFTSEEIEKIKAYDKKIKEQMKEKKQNRKTVLTLIEESMFSDAYLDNGHWLYKHTDGTSRYFCKEIVITRVVDYYKNTGKLVREFAMVSQCQTLLLKYHSGYSSILVQRIFEKM